MNNLGFAEGMIVGAARCDAAAARGEKGKTFDWDTAARLIKERNPTHVEAGLSGDWDYTGGTIFDTSEGGIVTHEYTFLASMWATPQIEIDGERIDCYIEGMDSGSKWPESARAILNAE